MKTENEEITGDLPQDEPSSVATEDQTNASVKDSERVGKRIRTAFHHGAKFVQDRIQPVEDEQAENETVTRWIQAVNEGIWKVPVTSSSQTSPWLHNLYLLNLTQNPHWCTQMTLYDQMKYPSFEIEDENRTIVDAGVKAITAEDLLNLKPVSDAIRDVAEIRPGSSKPEVIKSKLIDEDERLNSGVNKVCLTNVNGKAFEYDFCPCCNPHIVDGTAKLDEIVQDRETFFGTNTGKFSHLFYSTSFWRLPTEEQTQLVQLVLNEDLSTNTIFPTAVGLFINSKRLLSYRFTTYRHTNVTWSQSAIKASRHNDRDTSETATIRLQAVEKAVRLLADKEITVPRYPGIGGLDRDGSIAKSINRKSMDTFWSKYFVNENPDRVSISHNRQHETVTLKLHHAILRRVLEASYIRSVLTRSRGTSIPTVRSAAMIGDIINVEEFLNLMRMELPIPTVASRTFNMAGWTDYGMYIMPEVLIQEKYCTDCGTVLLTETQTTTTYDSGSWYDSSFPLLMTHGVDLSSMADFVSLSAWAIKRRPRIATVNQASSIVNFDITSATYATKNALTDIENSIRMISMEFENYEMPQAVKNQIIAGLTLLRSKSSMDAFTAWIEDSVTRILTYAKVDDVIMPLDSSISGVVRGRFVNRANAWIRVATKKAKKTSATKVLLKEDPDHKFVISTRKSLTSTYGLNKAGKVRYFSYTGDKSDAVIFSGSTSVATMLEPSIDNLHYTNYEQETRSAAELVGMIKSSLYGYIPPGVSLSIDFSAILVDVFTGKYNKEEGQLIAFTKDMFGSSVWTNATVTEERKMMTRRDLADLTTLEHKLERSISLLEEEDKSNETMSATELKQLDVLRGKYTYEKQFHLHSVYHDDVAITSLVSSLPEALQRYSVLDVDGDQNIVWKGLMSCVFIPCNSYTLREIRDSLVDKVCDEVLNGNKEISLKITFLNQARLMKSALKIDHRFIVGDSIPARASTVAQLKEDCEMD